MHLIVRPGQAIHTKLELDTDVLSSQDIFLLVLTELEERILKKNELNIEAFATTSLSDNRVN